MKKYCNLLLFIVVFLLSLPEFSAHAADAYSNHDKVVCNKKTQRWELMGQIVNNSQTHKVVRQDYRKIYFDATDREGRKKKYSSENRQMVQIVVPPIGVKEWKYIFATNKVSEIVITKVDARFSMMPDSKYDTKGNKTIIINK